MRQTDQVDLAAFYRACRLFVYPSKAEGFGIPPLEAAACHAPVLCSSVTAMKDFAFFEPHTFDPTNDTDFEQKLSGMIHEPPSAEFTAKVAAHIAQHYNWQQSSNSFYNLLQANYSI
jgi:glycosyltransferase involved in cell wall biosynthesis